MDNRTSGSTLTQTTSTAAVPTVTAPASAGTPVPAPATAAPTAPQTPEAAPGGAGDEEAIRVPVAFAVRRGAVTPPTVTVPAFLTLEVAVRSTDGAAHTVAVAGVTLAAAADGETATLTVPGQQAGTYPVTVDGARAGALVVGDEPGP